MVHRETTSDSEWQRVVQGVTTNDNEWPFLFFQVREEPTTKHPKENSLKIESNPARGVSEIRDVEDLWQWSKLEIRLRLSSVNHTTKTIHYHHHHHHHHHHHWIGPLKKNYWVKSRNKPIRRNINSKKEEWQKQLFSDFHQNKCS